MTFADVLAADMQAMLDTDTFCQEATYRAPDHSETTITVDALPEYVELRETDGLVTKMRIRYVSWDVATLGTINLRGTIIIGDTEWAIASQSCQDDVQMTVRLERHELREHTRAGFRQP